MDHMMPEMDGIEAAAEIRKLGMRNEELGIKRGQVPIIALTANAVTGMREMFLENGFDDFLTKPIDVSKLDEMIERWIPENKRAMSNEQLAINNEQLTINNEKLPDKNAHPHSSFLIPNSSLLSIPGVDTARGIVMTGGEEGFYRQVLDVYCKDALERMPQLQAVPERDDLLSFITHVHSLKSASASIGAAEVSREAKKLEDAGLSGDLAFIKDNLPAFAEHLTELVGNIRAALKDSQVPNAESSIDNSRAPVTNSPLFIELAEALKSQNAAEIDRILSELCKQAPNAATKKIVDQISDYVLMAEYEKAGKLLR
jgi:CheY-like chemotaxis protein